ncbi:MAG: methyltransferase domain-containing protein [Theionarchaea archaeon]|nr:methyltransferase domain-containing protein [Theionarchaea archaeon]
MNEEPESVALRISRPFGKKLVELAGISKGFTVLDIGTGLGPVFFPAVDRVKPHGLVIGIDISDEMVRGTYNEITYKNAVIIQADAKTLPFKDDSFDVVLSGFSYIYFSCTEVVRVLKEGGQVALSSWASLGDINFMAEHVSRYMPVNSHEVCHEDTPEKLRDLLCEHGFESIKIIQETHDFTYMNEEQWWDEMMDSGWSYYAEIVGGIIGMDKFKREVFDGLQGLKRDDGIPFTLSALLVFGTKGKK